MDFIVLNKQELREVLSEMIAPTKEPIPSPQEERQFLSLDEGVEHIENRGLKISKSYLYYLTGNNQIPFRRFGKRKIFFDAEELNVWINSRLERKSGTNEIISTVAQEARKKGRL